MELDESDDMVETVAEEEVYEEQLNALMKQLQSITDHSTNSTHIKRWLSVVRDLHARAAADGVSLVLPPSMLVASAEDPGVAPSLLKLHLTHIHELVRLKLTSYAAVVLSLSSSDVTITKRLLTEALTLLTSLPLTSTSLDPLTCLLRACITLSSASTESSSPVTPKVKTLASKLLQLLTTKLIKHLLSAEGGSSVREGVSVLLESLLDDPLALDAEDLESYCRMFLKQAMTFKPELPIASVIGHQQQFRSSAVKGTMFKVLFKLCCGAGVSEVLSTLDSVVQQQEVNWAVLLPLVSVLLCAHTSASDNLKSLIHQYLSNGCAREELELLILGFVLARQCCSEGSHVFPSYPHWFSSTFSSANTSPASTKREFSFLMKFLTDLVPLESSMYLRTQVTQSIYYPRGCQEVLRDYQQLARARLAELSTSSPCVATVTDEGIADVLKAVTHFRKTGNIHSSVLEAAMFRSNYFQTVFMPALFKPRRLAVGCDAPDYQLQLAEALVKAGKISNAELVSFKSACKQFEEESKIHYTFPSDSRECLQFCLKELTRISKGPTSNDGNRVTPVISRLSHSIADILAPTEEHIAGHAVLSTVDVKTRNNSADEILDLLLSSLAECTEEARRPSWLPQLTAVVSCSYSLQTSLLRSICDLHLNQRQLNLFGILLHELSMVEDKTFLPICCPESSKVLAQHEFYLRSFPVCSVSDCSAALSVLESWKQWRSRNCSTGSSVLQTHLEGFIWCLKQRLSIVLDTPDHRMPSAISETDPVPSLQFWLDFEARVKQPRDHMLVAVSKRSQVLLRKLLMYHSSESTEVVLSSILKSMLRAQDVNVFMMMLNNYAARLPRASSVSLMNFWINDQSFYDPLLFLSVCSCLPHHLFFGPLSTHDCSSALQQLLSKCQETDCSPYLAVEVTSFLLSALLQRGSSTSSDGGCSCIACVNSPAVNSLLHSCMFHWHTVKYMFDDPVLQSFQHEQIKHPQLLTVLDTLRSSMAGSLPSQLKALSKVDSISAGHFAFTNAIRGDDLEWAEALEEKAQLNLLLAASKYIGCKILIGDILWKDFISETAQTKDFIMPLRACLTKQLKMFKSTSSSLGLIADNLEKSSKSNQDKSSIRISSFLGLILGCVLALQGNFTNAVCTEALILEILSASVKLSEVQETEDNYDGTNSESKRQRLHLNGNDLIEINKKISEVLALLPSEVLSRVPGDLLSRCSAQIKEALRANNCR